MAYRVSFAAMLDALRDDEFGPDIAFVDPLAKAPPFLWDCEPAAILARAHEYVGQELAEESLPEPAPRAAPIVLPSDDAEAIERELGLATIATRSGLLRARREFMWANHPDRRPEWPSDLATRRVALANMLIDRALRQPRKAS